MDAVQWSFPLILSSYGSVASYFLHAIISSIYITIKPVSRSSPFALDPACRQLRAIYRKIDLLGIPLPLLCLIGDFMGMISLASSLKRIISRC